MKLSAIKLFALALSVAALGTVGVLTKSAKADGCPATNCQPIGGHPCAAPGYCETMPWGALRCLAGTNGGPGHYEGFMNQWCH